ncbi:MAG: hypothetical protein LBT42_08530 [Tannerella sp.]|nr:hypothetical protein [Tannerella sp.]
MWHTFVYRVIARKSLNEFSNFLIMTKPGNATSNKGQSAVIARNEAIRIYRAPDCFVPRNDGHDAIPSFYS